ncbi:MAG: oligosaccharide flippase family protein, partial [Firmicutes bacterium]|nr:oligosaccharide flippase family protein [Bacillota bacterium]
MAIGSVKRNILTLTFANLCIGLVEFVFSLYLSRVLGAGGLGMLHLVTPINCLFLSFMTEGLVTTTSKISAGHYASGRLGLMDRSIKVFTVFSFCWSLVLVVVVFLTARPIANRFLGEPSLYYPILSTCPLMLLMSVSNIVKGHFLGLARIKVPAVINVTEKLLRFPILYLLIRFCLNRFAVPAVTFVYLCYAIGEIHSVVWLIVYYRWDRHRLSKTVEKSSWVGMEPNGKRVEQKADCRVSAGTLLKPLIAGAAPICSTQ